MIDWLISLDAKLFHFFNAKLANPLFDLVMPMITNDWTLRAALLVILIYLLVFGKRAGRITGLLCLITVAVTDQVSSTFLKQLFCRIRPCHVLDQVNLLVNCSHGWSFPSSHAANSFGQAVILGFHFRRYAPLFYLSAAVISFSRVAVGVHYPFDLLAGMVVGLLGGLAVYGIYVIVTRRERHPQREE